MRRFLFGVVIASITATAPNMACGNDREIAKTVISELQQHKANGELKGFDIDLKVEKGVVYLTGQVANASQRSLVLEAAEKAVGTKNIVNKLSVKADDSVMTASGTGTPRPTAKPLVSDSQITDTIIDQLQQSKTSGLLRGFELDVSTVNKDVWLRGKVSNQEQKDHILNVASHTTGVSRVIDDISVVGDTAVHQASTGGLMPSVEVPAPIPQVSSMPVAGGMQMTPRPMAPSGLASAQMGQYPGGGAPAGVPAAVASYGMGAPRYDQPNMPGYAWPSYAAYPNYAAVTYPKQYSPSAWPYIGPFYPYPQVPLGWRKVALEWDDGLWYLDFSAKH